MYKLTLSDRAQITLRDNLSNLMSRIFAGPSFWSARKKNFVTRPRIFSRRPSLEGKANLLLAYWLPPNTCAMTTTPVIRRAVSKLRAQICAVRLRSDSRLEYFAWVPVWTVGWTLACNRGYHSISKPKQQQTFLFVVPLFRLLVNLPWTKYIVHFCSTAGLNGEPGTVLCLFRIQWVPALYPRS